ncbi:hypothetical protein [Phycicoccus sp. Root101]|uniref:hypothetical protein n=1 Tax=Phycicoccus sp. Root101 TaxID=1736421 RepID=UPI0007027BF9|nr:hypothetical protein [Phycicoccus sp. Root101]KQU66456.1 hypothetical protein ASC58_15605 [Phycicoccus sp. Root101]
MSEDSHRISLLADDRRYDLVAPANAQVGDLLAALGIAPRNSPYAVATPAGRVIALGEVLGDAVPEGTLLTVIRATTHEVTRDVLNFDRSPVAGGARSPEGQGGRQVEASEATVSRRALAEATRRRDDLAVPAPVDDAGLAAPVVRTTSPVPVATATLLRWVGAGLAVAAVTVLAPGVFRAHATPDPLVAGAAAALLLLSGLALATDHAASSAARLSRLAAPLLGFAAGLSLPVAATPSAGRISLIAACTVATALAGVARITGGPLDRASRAAMTALAVVGGLAVVGVLLDWPAFAVAAVVAGLVPGAVRLLPSLGFEVPDEQLVDVDRLSTTIWTAREQRRRRFRRLRVAEVDTGFHAARETVAAGTAWGCLLAPVALVVVVATPGRSGWSTWGTVGLCASITVALGFQSRTVRDRLPRYALLTTSALAALLGTYAAGRLVGVGIGVALACTAVALGLVAVAAAVALGRGWHSTRLSRLADMLEGLAVVLSLPAAALAAGGFETMARIAAS